MDFSLDYYENITFALRRLYNRYGYSRYKMSKFEEYDLYARNKDFLLSDHVITFTDLNGKLMALKPDVTLSIVKNSKDTPDTVQKLYYNENVYRAEKGMHGFREIMQTGLECLGNIDEWCICEVLTLAAESLRCIAPQCILEISHLGLVSTVIDIMGVPKTGKDALLACIGQKNLHEMEAVCREYAVEPAKLSLLQRLVSASGAPEKVLPEVRRLLSGIVSTDPIDQLMRLLEGIGDSSLKEMLRIDFSVVDDIHYYNGIVFKGFVQGVPSSILSGGQYDKLMGKMKRTSGAIGFAVYLDKLDRLIPSRQDYDVDTVLLYDGATPLPVIRAQIDALTAAGERVIAQPSIPENLKYRQLVKL